MWKMAAVGLSSLSRSRIVPALAVYSIFWPLIVTVCLLSTSFSFGSPAFDLSLSGSPAALSAGFSAECSGGLSSVLAGASAAERLAGTAEAARATANRSILNMRGCCRPPQPNTNQNSRITGVLIVGSDVILDRFDQVLHAFEGTAADPFSCDFAKPPLNQIQPGSAGGNKVQVNSLTPLNP